MFRVVIKFEPSLSSNVRAGPLYFWKRFSIVDQRQVSMVYRPSHGLVSGLIFMNYIRVNQVYLGIVVRDPVAEVSAHHADRPVLQQRRHALELVGVAVAGLRVPALGLEEVNGGDVVEEVREGCCAEAIVGAELDGEAGTRRAGAEVGEDGGKSAFDAAPSRRYVEQARGLGEVARVIGDWVGRGRGHCVRLRWFVISHSLPRSLFLLPLLSVPAAPLSRRAAPADAD